jgi:hypothetical protein
MKHILNITDFFNKISESKLSKQDIQNSNSNFKSVRNFISKHKKDKNIWNDVFKGRNRIYFDMNGNELDKKNLIKNSKDIILTINNSSDLDKVETADKIIYNSPETIKEIVTKALVDLGYLFIDYDNNKCSKDKDGLKNLTSITSILSRKNIAEIYKKIDLLNKYNQRDNKNVFNKPIIIKQKTVDDSKLMMVFTNHPVDLMTMSSNRPWEQTSCMRIGGFNHEYVYADIEYGSVVCFQTVFGDYNIELANARLLYKPYVDVDDSDIYILYSDGTMYGSGKNNFYNKSLEVVNNTFNSGVEGTFELHCKIYNDNQASVITKTDDYIEEGNRINIGNFYDVYSPEDASIELYNELDYDNMDVYDFEKLNNIFADLSIIDKMEILDIHLDYIEHFFVDSGYSDKDDFISYYLPNLLEVLANYDGDKDDKEIQKLLIICYVIMGSDFLFENVSYYIEYIFDIFDEIPDRIFIKNSKETLKSIKITFEDENIKADFDKLNRIYDRINFKQNEDADHGLYKEIKTPYFIINIFKNKIKVKDENLMVFVGLCNVKNSDKWNYGFITIDSLVNYINNTGTIVEKKRNI